MATDKSKSYVVAAGRTVIGADGKRCGPGESVELSAGDAKSLSSLGFLLMDGVADIPTGNGPVFDSSEGPTVRGA
jgi:hypothetical protein